MSPATFSQRHLAPRADRQLLRLHILLLELVVAVWRRARCGCRRHVPHRAVRPSSRLRSRPMSALDRGFDELMQLLDEVLRDCDPLLNAGLNPRADLLDLCLCLCLGLRLRVLRAGAGGPRQHHPEPDGERCHLSTHESPHWTTPGVLGRRSVTISCRTGRRRRRAGLIALTHFVHQRDGRLQDSDLATQRFKQTVARRLAARILREALRLSAIAWSIVWMFCRSVTRSRDRACCHPISPAL